METLKIILKQRFRLLSMLVVSLGLSLVLLMIRIKLHQSIFLLFLVWNLFLAVIPFGITSYLISKQNISKVWFILAFGFWLLFLPNAPYITTDLLHLMHSERDWMWLDVLVILSFAINGLLLFFLSVSDMEKLLEDHLKNSLVKPALLCTFGLTAFGIYLGRFLRYNSWEILEHPKMILSDILNILFLQPNKEAWLFTLTFGSFLWISYELLKALSFKS